MVYILEDATTSSWRWVWVAMMWWVGVAEGMEDSRSATLSVARSPKFTVTSDEQVAINALYGAAMGCQVDIYLFHEHTTNYIETTLET